MIYDLHDRILGCLVTAGMGDALGVPSEAYSRAEILQEYGCENLYLKKTGQTALDEEGNHLDVWMLSFKPEDMEGADD